MSAHVPYESRLELARLILADFDASVRVIVSQPFLLEVTAEGRPRRHVPDFLLVDERQGVRIVNVKPRERLERAVVAEALAWAHGLFESRGWRTEVWSGVDAVLLANVRFLAGFRRGGLVDAEVLAALASAATSHRTIGEVEASLAGRWSPLVVRPALLHLLWRGQLQTDLTVPLTRSSRLAGA